MSGIIKYSEIATPATSAEVDANSQFGITVDMLGTPTTKYLTGEVLKEVIRDEFGDVFLTAGTGISVSHDDAGNTFTISVTGVLDDLMTLGAPASDGQFIVATGPGAFAYESGATVRDSLGLGTSDNVTFNNVTANGTLGVTGAATFSSTVAISANSGAYVSTGPSGAPLQVVTTGSPNTPVNAYFSATGTSDSIVRHRFYSNGVGIWQVNYGDDITYFDDNGAGSYTERFKIYQGTTGIRVASTLTLASGSITDSGNAITFGAANLSTTGTGTFAGLTTTGSVSVGTSLILGTASAPASGHIYKGPTTGTVIYAAAGSTYDFVLANSAGSNVITVAAGTINTALAGTLASGTITVSSDLTLASGSITSASGAISFGNENLSTTGTATFGFTTLNEALAFASNGTASAGRILKTAASGLTMRGITGSTYDLQIQSATGVNVLGVTTGTSNIVFGGNLSTTGTLASGNATVTGTATVNGDFNVDINSTGTIARFNGSGFQRLDIVSEADTTVFDFRNVTNIAFRRQGSDIISLTSPGATVAGTLDVSGDTAVNNAATTSAGFVTSAVYTGAYFGADGLSGFSRDGASPLSLNRLTSHGTQLTLRINGTISSGIATAANSLVIQTGASLDTALTLDGSQNATFAGGVTLSAGDLTVTSLSRVYLDGGSDSYIWEDSADSVTIARGGQSNFRVNGTGVQAIGKRLISDTGLLLGSTSTSNNAQLYSTKTYSNASGTDIGSLNVHIQSVATTGELRAFSTRAQASNSSGTVASIVGIDSDARTTGAGGTTTNAYGARMIVRAQNATSTITNGYTLYLSDKDRTGTITNDWALYSADTAASYLAGDVRIGTTSAAGNELLRVNGLIHSDSDSIIVDTAKTPASASATGTQGQIAWDADYIYVCTATDTWKRAAILTWV